MKKNRPVNLNLLTINFPMTAIVSILHRISGVLMFLGFPLVLYLFSVSIQSESGFNKIPLLLNCFWARFVIMGFILSAGYHFFAGVRHIIMDLGWLEDLTAARITARILVILLIISAILGGWWLCSHQ